MTFLVERLAELQRHHQLVEADSRAPAELLARLGCMPDCEVDLGRSMTLLR